MGELGFAPDEIRIELKLLAILAVGAAVFGTWRRTWALRRRLAGAP